MNESPKNIFVSVESLQYWLRFVNSNATNARKLLLEKVFTGAAPSFEQLFLTICIELNTVYTTVVNLTVQLFY